MALALAQSLQTIGKPAYWPAGAVNAIAEDLVRWCKGALSVDGLNWSAQAQAYWLVTEARERWREWTGTSDLHALFVAKFETKRPDPEAPVKRAPRCEACGGSGWRIKTNREGVSGALRCKECGGRGAVGEPQLCPACNGKGTVIVDGKREWCACVPEEERQKSGWALLYEVERERLALAAAAAKPKPEIMSPPLTQADVDLELAKLGRLPARLKEQVQ